MDEHGTAADMSPSGETPPATVALELGTTARRVLRAVGAAVDEESGEANTSAIIEETGSKSAGTQLGRGTVRYHLDDDSNRAHFIDRGLIQRQPHREDLGGNASANVYRLLPRGREVLDALDGDVPSYGELVQEVERLERDIEDQDEAIDTLIGMVDRLDDEVAALRDR